LCRHKSDGDLVTSGAALSSLLIDTRVNGRRFVGEIESRELLLDFLRERLGLSGTKRSCDIEICGACAVLLNGLAVSSCTTLALEADGGEVTTIEGVGTPEELGPVQRCVVETAALQCGFCTPGFVMTIHSLVAELPEASFEDVVEYLSGSLCRCTGYQGLLEAAWRALGHENRPWAEAETE
jgi:carbon-monoxide dehydrogenase small subunit